MRSSSRLFASVKSASKYLEANTPTGLTGLITHPAPRPALIYTYRKTLNKLKEIPADSVYRQSTEALTKHRLSIIEATIPPGYEQWAARVKQEIEKSSEAYSKMKNEDGSFSIEKIYQDSMDNWDGMVTRKDARQEGSNTSADAERKARMIQEEVVRVDKEAATGRPPTLEDLEPEPPLTAEQISEVEVKMAAGLIEEVIQVAEGELEVVDSMLQYQAWEPLEEQSPSGQWKYFERGDVV